LAPRLGRTGSKICPAAAAFGFMIYEDVEFVIRAGLGRNEWTLLISFPAKAEPSVSQASGSWDDAIATAHKRIDGWMRRQG
jgi:hypothetical protein